jgi:hypothetical protein
MEKKLQRENKNTEERYSPGGKWVLQGKPPKDFVKVKIEGFGG